MSLFRTFLIGIILFVAQVAPAQKTRALKISKADRMVITNLQAHISYLSDDKLEGRRAGTAGEKLAMEYISLKFKEIGVVPRGSNGFYQPFEIYDGKQIN